MSSSSIENPVIYQPRPDGLSGEQSLYIQHYTVARFSVDVQGNRKFGAYFGDLRVEKSYRERGYATRLFSALAGLAIDKGFNSLAGSVDSQHTLRIISKLFAEEAVRFSVIDPTTNDDINLPITLPQAIQSLERAEKFEDDLDYRDHCFGVNVQLSGLKTLPESVIVSA